MGFLLQFGHFELRDWGPVMLVTRLKPDEFIRIEGTEIRNVGGGPCVLGITGPAKVALHNIQNPKTQKFETEDTLLSTKI